MKTIFLGLFFTVLLQNIPTLTSAANLPTTIEGFACSADPRSSRLQVVWNDSQIRVNILNPSGYSMMPQMEGPLTQFLIPFFKMQAEDLQAIGDQIEFIWPREKCQVNARGNVFAMDCSGSVQSSVASGITASSLSSTSIEETSAQDVTKKMKYRFVLEQTNFYFVSLEFPLSSCYQLTVKKR